jgi:hypothetical protein
LKINLKKISQLKSNQLKINQSKINQLISQPINQLKTRLHRQ